jgi:deoxycytidylate deaminase
MLPSFIVDSCPSNSEFALNSGAAVSLAAPCASRQVLAVLVAVNGRVFIGSNGKSRPTQTCPRKTLGFRRGEGWYLCREVCGQTGHAETNVLAKAGADARGATLYLINHDRACPDCKEAIRRAGVRRLVIVPPQELTSF